ncbi:unnamed protein product [Spirodela intermedia]|uniref:Uncharacterized protein n=1 Tax=Spirodela intermedia TaxID=51605 RepID=A0A7I8J233_SPIIN|nr:unnamed protein product [Spirodela intermedia]CAA6664218.1 unnamed protein product [Spirodela intermedia]
MSATKHSDSAPISVSDPQPNQTQAGNAAAEEVGFAECECCGLREECTEAYIERVREIYDGRWVCGLCAEAVKEEICRSSPCRPITTDEALDQHAAFCRSCQSSPVAADANEHLIAAMRQLLRRSLDSPRGIRSTPSSPSRRTPGDGEHPRRSLARSDSCFPSLAG